MAPSKPKGNPLQEIRKQQRECRALNGVHPASAYATINNRNRQSIMRGLTASPPTNVAAPTSNFMPPPAAPNRIEKPKKPKKRLRRPAAPDSDEEEDKTIPQLAPGHDDDDDEAPGEDTEPTSIHRMAPSVRATSTMGIDGAAGLSDGGAASSETFAEDDISSPSLRKVAAVEPSAELTTARVLRSASTSLLEEDT